MDKSVISYNSKGLAKKRGAVEKAFFKLFLVLMNSSYERQM
jgi:hypothetical protein